MKLRYKGPKSYTVLIVPNPTSKTYRFSVSRKQLKSVLVGAVFFVLLFSGLSFHYFYTDGKLSELQTLRQDNRTQKVEIQTLSTRIADINKKMTRLKELDTKIRIIANITPPDENDQLLGQGGGDEESVDSLRAMVRDGHPDALKKMHSHLEILEVAALSQEVSFLELESAMKDKKRMWAYTPSIKPVRGWMTSGFGKRTSPFTGHLTMHRGLDIAARHGTPIVAPSNGVVSYEGFDRALGKVVKLNHGYGYKTLYGHLSKTIVKVGQKIKRGSIIGYVGNTGRSTGPHLHYSVYVNNVPVNPTRYILN